LIPLIQILLHAAALGVMWTVSRGSPPFWRFNRILVSMPLITVLVVDIDRSLHWMASLSELNAATARIVSVLILVVLWAYDVGTWVSARVASLMEGHGTEGFRADYHDAKRARAEANLDRALELTRREFSKSGGDFEGAMLAADLYQQMGRPKRAIPFLEAFIRRNVGTEFQLDAANARLTALRSMGWFSRFRKTPAPTVRNRKGGVRLRSSPSEKSIKLRF